MGKKRIAILHAQVPFVIGGAELMVQALRDSLIQKGFDAEIVAVPFKWYPQKSLYDSMLAWRMLDLSEADGRKIDLVIGTKFPSYGVIHENKVIWMIQQYRQAYDLYHSPYGLAQQEEGDQIQKRVHNYDKLTISEAKAVYTISKNTADRLKRFNGLDSEVLYQPPPLVGRYYCDTFEDYILSVGRLDKLKRNDLLIRALCYCNKDVRVKIAGKGDQRKELEKLADQWKVRDRVEFLGFVSDDELLRLYAHARMVFFAPIDEDYGYITLEAFLSGKPVLTCKDAGGVLEFVEDGASGCICDASPELLGEKINRLWNNKEECKKMGREGCQRVKKFSWDHVVKKLTESL